MTLIALERTSLLGRIVAVSRDSEVQRLAQKYCREVFGADDLRDALDIVKKVNPNLILFDHRFNPGHVCEFLKTADNYIADVPVVVVGSDEGDIGLPKEFIRMGAYDYLQSKRDYNRLEQIIRRINNNSNDTECGLLDEEKSLELSHKQDMSRFFCVAFAG